MAKLMVLALAVGIVSLPGAAAAKYASIIIDADTGDVLQEHGADAANYPASLTKMMTLYLVFEAVETGKLTLDQRLAVSSHAANRAPSKLGLQAGDTIAVREAILALVTKSANDAAATVAEGLAGSESAFAERMTQKARRLGMKNTVFYNASGLPNRPENHTTARDLALLARALYRDFPGDYHYFATREFAWHGATFANHNHLMSSFQGMDGIKTGYIRASGFNLAASAMRGNRRLIGIVMGGESARARDTHMAALLNDAFARGGRGKFMVAKAEEPAAPTEADSEADAEPQPETAGVASGAVAALSPVGRAEAATVTPHRRKGAAAAATEWAIQIGAFAQRSAAEKAAHATLAKLPAARGKQAQILAPGKTDKERVYRVRFARFSRKDASTACHVLHRKHQSCAVLPPSAVNLASR